MRFISSSNFCLSGDFSGNGDSTLLVLLTRGVWNGSFHQLFHLVDMLNVTVNTIV